MHIRCAALVTKRLVSPARSPHQSLPHLHTISLLSSVDLRRHNAATNIASSKFSVPCCDTVVRICPDPLSSICRHLHVLSAIECSHIRFHTGQRATARHEGAKPPFVDDLVSACRSRRFEILVMDMMKTRLTGTDISRPVQPRGLLLHRVLFRCNCKLRNFFLIANLPF
jgi:hypothetical protein